MVRDFITKETRIFEINSKKTKIENIEQLEAIVENINSKTNVPKDLIYGYASQWYYVNGEYYYFKDSKSSKFNFINELLGEKISEYFGLDTVHYSIAKLCIEGMSDNFGIVSKNFCNKEYTYKTAYDYNLLKGQDLSVLKRIKRICQSEDEYSLLVDDLKKFFIRDFFTSQRDRHGGNFLFMEKEEGISLAPLYDYEHAYDPLDVHVYINQIGKLDINDSNTQYLLKNDSKFQELLYMLMDFDMTKTLTKVEDIHKINIQPAYKDYYIRMNTDMKKLVKDYKLVK